MYSNTSFRAISRVANWQRFTNSCFNVPKKLSTTALSPRYPRVIPAVAFSAHAAPPSLLAKSCLKFAAGVLTAAIAVMNQARFRETWSEDGFPGERKKEETKRAT